MLQSPNRLAERDNSAADAEQTTGGNNEPLRTEQLLELGLAEEVDGGVRVSYSNFETIQNDMPVSLIGA